MPSRLRVRRHFCSYLAKAGISAARDDLNSMPGPNPSSRRTPKSFSQAAPLLRRHCLNSVIG